MRYYKIRHERKVGRTPEEAVSAVPLREVEARATDELRDSYGDEKIDSLIRKVREKSVNFSKDKEMNVVMVYGTPLVWRQMIRDLFPEYNVTFQP